MPAVVVDSSVLITLAAGEQLHLLRELYTTIYVPPEVWNACSFWSDQTNLFADRLLDQES
ncbi:MAG: hypothetical protein FJ403_07635 [Verrucomicrobia bacterium]|nr:hypothetical protein [Verrucomicrobiota bacterium]